MVDGPCSVLEMICALADDMSRECGQYDDKYFVIVLLKNLGLDPFQTYSIDAVKTAADVYGVEFVVATRNGKYSSAVKESAVLKEVLANVIEINGRPENVKMNN